LEEFVHVAVGVEEVVVSLSWSGVGVVSGLPDVFAHAVWELGEVWGVERGGRVGGETVVDEGDAIEDGAGATGGRDDVDALAALVVDPGGLRAVGGPADGSELPLAVSLPLFESLGDSGASVFELGEPDEGGLEVPLTRFAGGPPGRGSKLGVGSRPGLR
jgi:hypothetical protein